MSTNLPPVDDGPKIDDRMFDVERAYIQAIEDGKEALAAELLAAIKAGDIERGLAIMRRVPPGPPLPESGQGR